MYKPYPAVEKQSGRAAQVQNAASGSSHAQVAAFGDDGDAASAATVVGARADDADLRSAAVEPHGKGDAS